MEILSWRFTSVIVFGFLFSNSKLSAQVNSWNSPGSGNWEDSHWSLGVLPSSGQDILITNAGWKAVAVSANTIANFPQTLTVNSITVSSPTNSSNTLLLNYSGLQTPLSADSLSIAANSAVVVYDATLHITNSLTLDGTFTEAEYSSVTVDNLFMGDSSPAVFNLTNSLFMLSGSALQTEDIVNHSVFNQHGGTNSGDIALYYSGEYDLADGGQVTGEIEMRGGNFNQWDGNLSCGFYFDSGIYQLAGGTLLLGDVHIPTQMPQAGSDQFNFVQTGGTNFVGNFTMDSCLYTMSNGVFSASGSMTLSAYLGINGEVTHSDFYQSGGTSSNTGMNIYGSYNHNYDVRSSSYNLSGGILMTPFISMDMGEFDQSGGINQVTNLTLGDVSSYYLSGGLLQSSSMQMDGGNFFNQAGVFQQTGGTNQAGYVSLSACDYDLSGGLFVANNLWILGAQINHTSGTVTAGGLLVFSNAVWNEQTTGATLASLDLFGTNDILMPSNSSCILDFADSNGNSWIPHSLLQIENWKGSLYGGGRQQIIFEPPSSGGPLQNGPNGLDGEQVAQIRFDNPAGLAPGTYPARILDDGEIVPDSGAPLPLLVGLATFTNHLPQIQLMGDIGTNYVIQASTNLINWDDILTLTNTIGTISFIDADATNYPRRFYRAQLMP